MPSETLETRTHSRLDDIFYTYCFRTEAIYESFLMKDIDRPCYDELMKMARAKYLEQWERIEAEYHKDAADEVVDSIPLKG